MKKTTTISIAQQLFHIEEDAFILLDDYLSSIKKHFANQSDANDIISDIEFRIAEHFNSQEAQVVTKAVAQQVIDIMGTVDQFTDTDTHTAVRQTKKLYRDVDGKMVAGVASGLAHYFGISRSLIRVLFALSIFFGGFGIAVYIVLWIAVPEAKTSAQKLEMRGEETTLKTMSEFVRDTYENTNSVFEQETRKFFSQFMRIAVKLFGIAIVVGSFFTGVLVSILAAVGVVKIPQQMMMDQLISSSTNTVYYFGAIGFGYIAIMLPIVIVLLWGIDLVWKKQILKKVSTAAFISIWFIVILLASFCSVQVISRYIKIERSIIEHTQVVQAKSLEVQQLPVTE